MYLKVCILKGKNEYFSKYEWKAELLGWILRRIFSIWSRT